jgi:arginine decarboxylase
MRMEELVPKGIFLTRGVGVHRNRLNAFELALRDGGIERMNLVSVSSILPPGCTILSRTEGIKRLHDGQIAFCVLARQESNEPGRLMAASIGVAIPRDRSRYGYLSEHHSFGEKAVVAGEYAEDLAATMLATTLGVEFDPDRDYDERREIYRISGAMVGSRHIVQSARGHKNGLWTSCVAAGVFIF